MMRIEDLRRAVKMVEMGELEDIAVWEEAAIFDGFGLESFKPIVCTIQQLACLVLWQARTFAGTWDNEAIAEIRANRRKFTVVN
jgi:hypothetical protein